MNFSNFRMITRKTFLKVIAKLQYFGYSKCVSTDNWIAFIEAERGDDNDTRTAARTGISPSAVSRWRSGTQPRPQQVIDFAQAYGLNTLTALLAAGLINRADLAEFGTTVQAPSNINEFSTIELLDELKRRLEQLADTYRTVDSTDTDALRALVTAIGSPNVGGSSDTQDPDTLTQAEAEHLLRQEHHALAADEREGRDEEQTADTTA